MMRARRSGVARALSLALSLGLVAQAPLCLGACVSAPTDEVATSATSDAGEAVDTPQETQQTQAGETAGTLEDGTYEIEVTTDSSMFRAAHCTLEVTDGAMTAHLALPGEGFSRLYFGSAEEAEAAAAADASGIHDYHLGEDGLYTFDLPVEALDTELEVAAFGQRRDTWYDHTIAFASPASDTTSD